MGQASWRVGQWPWLPAVPAGSRRRVIIDNDFAGDPDDLFQLVHHLLSPSVDVRGIVCSHLPPGDGPDTAEDAYAAVGDLAAVMRLDVDGYLHVGASEGLASRAEPRVSDAARFIVAEAMRDEPGLGPLFYAAGGGLTDLASAYLIEPAIAERMTLVWIGGPEHDGLGYPPPQVSDPEYNLGIDITAAQVIFNDSAMPLWLVPRSTYRQCLVSDAELRRRVSGKGELGAQLYRAIHAVVESPQLSGLPSCETYVLGDSPLVLLTALQSFFEPDPSSSEYALRLCPRLRADGQFSGFLGREIRVYHRLDLRLMFEDFFAKLDEFTDWLSVTRRDGVALTESGAQQDG